MHILALPEETFITIFNLVDLKTRFNLYNTCKTIRKVISTAQNLNKYFYLSLNGLATQHTLNRGYFKAISLYYIEELNLSGVPDLTKSTFVPCIVRMKTLKTLDITYTNLIIPDLIDIKPKCINLTNIALNFSFDRNRSPKIMKSILTASQDLFQDFRNVHFVGAVENLVYSQLPMFILAKAKALNTVKFTGMRLFNSAVYENVYCSKMFWCQHFSVYFPDWKYLHMYYYDHVLSKNNSIFYWMYVKKFEFVIILKLNYVESKVLISPGIGNFFQETYNIEAECVTNISYVQFTGNSAFLFWDKETTQLNKDFFDKLTLKVKDFFPSYPKCDKENTFSYKNSLSNLFYMTPSGELRQRDEENPDDSPFKKRRIAPQTQILDYDSIFKEKELLELRIKFDCECGVTPMTLSPHSQYLRKITVLNIGGFYLFAIDFFSLLFKCCINLVTLNVESSPIHSCSLPVSNNIHLSRSLKNIRLVDKIINFKFVLLSFSRCINLENVHIVETTLIKQTNNFNENDCIPFIEKCKNMYNLFLQAYMSDAMKLKLLRLINKLKQKYKRSYLNVEVYNQNICYEGGFSYDPFIKPFNLSTIKDV